MKLPRLESRAGLIQTGLVGFLTVVILSLPSIAAQYPEFEYGAAGGLDDAPGTVLAQYVFEPYGSVALSETLVDSLAVELTTTIGHQGLHFIRLDDTSPAANTLAPTARGLYYNRNRFYSPDLGRFITRDPNATALPILTAASMNARAFTALLDALDPSDIYASGLNLYAYQGSNPVSGLDPLGLYDPFEDVDAIVMGWAAERTAFGQQLADQAIQAGISIATTGALTAVTYLFPPAGVLLSAYGAANAILDMRDDGVNAQNVRDLSLNLIGGILSTRAAMQWGTAAASKLRAGFSRFRNQFNRLRNWNRGNRSGDISLNILNRVCFVAGTLVLLPDGAVAPIERVELGSCVASWPDPHSSEPDEDLPISANAWRSVHLRMVRDNGATTDAFLLRPIEWIRRYRVQAGKRLQVAMPEIGFEGDARVVTVGPCPPLKPRQPGSQYVTGRLVTTRATVLDLYIEQVDEPIGTTAGHPFWSLRRDGWVAASDLKPGEKLWTVDGSATVKSVVPRSGTETVYNLEVHKNHTFFVSDAKLWVHNNCVKEAKKALRRNSDFRRWFHKVYKPDVKIPGAGHRNPNLPDEDILDAYLEWLDLGKPKAP